MQKLSTASRISLRFTIFTLIVVLFFGLVINVSFFADWRHQEQLALEPTPEAVQRLQRSRNQQVSKMAQAAERLREHFQQIAILEVDQPIVEDLLNANKVFGISSHEDNRYIYKVAGNEVLVRDVSMMVARQIGLIKLTLLLMIIFGVISYVGSRIFVRRALSDLHNLSKYVANLDVDNLQGSIVFDHLPDDDEIQTVARAINAMGKKIDTQVRSIKQFISYVSHEFKTPLMVMRTDAELALKSQKYQDGLEKNVQAIDTLNRLLESLLLLTRAQSGNSLQRDTVSIREVVDDCLEQVKLQHADDKEVEIVGEAELVCHQGSVERIVINLLENAYKYSKSGDAIEVVIDQSSLIIADTGVGMTAAELEHIWDPFWQADTSKGTDGGFGLGLALVKALVQLHGWNIRVESKKGKGTKFVIDWD